MPKLPVPKPRDVLRVLGQLGFVEVRQRESHKQFRASRGISPNLLRKIIEDIRLTPEEFLNRL